MADAIDDQVIRTTTRRLTYTASLLKGAWRKVQDNRPDADEAEEIDLRADLFELIRKGHQIRAAAVEAGKNVERLDEALTTAERRGKESRERSPQRNIPLPPGSPPRYETISIASTSSGDG